MELSARFVRIGCSVCDSQVTVDFAFNAFSDDKLDEIEIAGNVAALAVADARLRQCDGKMNEAIID